MLKEESPEVLDLDVTIGGGSRIKKNWARVCDVCNSAACRVYCRVDLAYLCAGCDAPVHANGGHERVSVCEVCERAPAAVMCRADAASLCAACDSDIHSANPLARRHHRVPVLPIPATFYGPLVADPCQGKTCMMMGDENGFLTQDAQETTIDEDEDEAASWLLLHPNPVKSNNNKRGNNDNEISCAGEVVDAYLDLAEFSSCRDTQFDDHYSINQHSFPHPHKNMSYGGESVVPNHRKNQLYYTQDLHNRIQLQGMEYENFNTGYGYPASISHSLHKDFMILKPNFKISVRDHFSHSLASPQSGFKLSMDVGIVPESTTISDASISYSRTSKGTIDLFSGPPVQMPQQLTQMDREARILRYREKKKARKFEKTIRYASRKDYAEIRPRIKGRFAKRTEVDTEVDQMFYAPLMAESGYGIVPSF